MKNPQVSIIISTYNSTDWLEKVLWSYQVQTFKNFEVIIADDGSGKETYDLINNLKLTMSYPIEHVWQDDNGFQKSIILNKAILACQSDYIIMSDGDCIARADFVETHFKNRQKGYFLSGGYFKLPMSVSKAITMENIFSQTCFGIEWLKKKGLKSSIKNNKLTSKGLKSTLLNNLTPTNASWNGHNSSGWKDDMLFVNGFDELMQYGGQDREFGERLFNSGIKSKQIRYSAICLHLDHPRSYKNQESIIKNLAVRKHTKKTKKIYTEFGIDKLNDKTNPEAIVLSELFI